MDNWINVTFSTKDHSTKTEMTYELRNNALKVESGDIPRFDTQINFHNTAKDLAREIKADLESILARIPEGYKLTIFAQGGEYANRKDFTNRGVIQELPGGEGQDAHRVDVRCESA